MTMKNNDDEFSNICESFIDLANNHSNSLDYKRVSFALLNAAARFNAFSIWANAENMTEFKSEKDLSKDRFCDQYKKLITENLNDFEENFDVYRMESRIE